MAVATREVNVAITRRRFTADEYQRMGEVGILHEDDRIELIRGDILEMAAIGFRHVYCVSDLDGIARDAVGNDAFVLVQSPFRLADDSEPQPDLLIVRRSLDRSALPTSADVLVVMEVSDSSLAYDRRVKLPLFGAASIPEAWIFDLNGYRIERHTEPYGGGYRTVEVARRGEKLASLTVPALTIDVDGLFGVQEESNGR
jgi:Uma2 family endonuclease